MAAYYVIDHIGGWQYFKVEQGTLIKVWTRGPTEPPSPKWEAPPDGVNINYRAFPLLFEGTDAEFIDKLREDDGRTIQEFGP